MLLAYSDFVSKKMWSSEISDNHRPFEWPNYLGGILGYSSSNCKIIACVKTAGDVKEEYTQSYTYVGGIVGFILSGDVYSSIISSDTLSSA